MKIQILSDVHSELLARYQSLSLEKDSKYRQWSGSVESVGADIVVLAGDIDLGTKGVEWAISESERLDTPFIYVAGNHEFYNREYYSTLKQLREITAGTSVHFLECDELIVEGVRFLGTTLWTNYNLFLDVPKEHVMKECGKALNDHQVIRISPDGVFTPRHALKLHTKSVAWLKNKLNIKRDGIKTVVVTHHGPSKSCQHENFTEGPISAAFYSDLDELVSQADAWIFGHTHFNIDVMKNNCRLISNQPGYPHERVEHFLNGKFINIC